MFKIGAKADHVQLIAARLAEGQRRAAAHWSTQVADGLSHKELADLVRVLAAELGVVGDAHAKRGRPKVEGFGTHEAQRAAIQRAKVSVAAAVLRDALTARRLIARKNPTPRDLGIFAVCGCGLAQSGTSESTIDGRVEEMVAAIRTDPAGATGALKPYAEQLLREWTLSAIPLQGFTQHARRKIAERCGVTVDQIKRAQ